MNFSVIGGGGGGGGGGAFGSGGGGGARPRAGAAAAAPSVARGTGCARPAAGSGRGAFRAASCTGGTASSLPARSGGRPLAACRGAAAVAAAARGARPRSTGTPSTPASAPAARPESATCRRGRPSWHGPSPGSRWTGSAAARRGLPASAPLLDRHRVDDDELGRRLEIVDEAPHVLVAALDASARSPAARASLSRIVTALRLRAASIRRLFLRASCATAGTSPGWRRSDWPAAPPVERLQLRLRALLARRHRLRRVELPLGAPARRLGRRRPRSTRPPPARRAGRRRRRRRRR